MQQLLFAVILSEMAVVLALSFKTPLRKLLIMSLDRAKRGRGPVVIKTVAATVCIVMTSSVYSMMKIQKRWMDEGSPNPTDQVLMAKHLLECTLMGGFIFLGLTIDRLHQYIRELSMRRKDIEAVKKQGRGFEAEKPLPSDEIRAMEEEIKTLQEKHMRLETELEAKAKELHSEDTNALALRKQSEGFLLEFNRLLEENQSLRNQLHSLDQKQSRSSSKKNT